MFNRNWNEKKFVETFYEVTEISNENLVKRKKCKKNWKILLPNVSEHPVSFGTKISIWPIMRFGTKCKGCLQVIF